MTGLKTYARDPALPALAGDPALCIPRDEELLELVARHLAQPGTRGASSAQLEYARWKPAQSITCTYSVLLHGGAREIVVYKRYSGDKALHVARHFQSNAHVDQVESALRPSAVLEREGICLFRFPADRVLRGAARVLNTRRLARRVDASGHFAPSVVRLRPSRAELVRFKPERRAVFRFDAKLRDPQGQHSSGTVGVRVLSPELAREIAARRRRLPASALYPTLLDAEDETGILLEAWLPGATLADDDFQAAHLAGAALAAFHKSLPALRVPAAAPASADLGSMFRVEARLEALWGRLQREPGPRPTQWIHGDLHPDQFMALPGSSLALLDLDALGPGHPADDLASWIADHIAADPRVTPEVAGAELLRGYASGARLPLPGQIERACRTQLVARAAASLRRLEVGALEKAGRLLEAALQPRFDTGHPR